MSFSKFSPISKSRAHIFSLGEEITHRILFTVRNDDSTEIAISMSTAEAEVIADNLMSAIDYVRGADARKVFAAEQEERDKIAGGERPEMHATERGELDGQTQVHPFLKAL